MRSATDPGVPGFETVKILDSARNTVFRVRDLSSGDDAVIKLLERANRPRLPKRLDRERRRLLRLCGDDVGLVPLLDHGISTDGRDYIVTPYYPIGSLEDQVAQGPMPWHFAAEIIEKVASIVGVVHDARLVLGDLRPSNVLLAAVGEPVISVFGMSARRFDDGRPEYIAPEADGDWSRLTPPADVYSLALLFGALIAGRGRGRSETDAEFLAELEALAPRRFVEVIEHGLAPAATNRHRDAATMASAIRAAIDADPEAEPSGVPAVAADDSFDLDEIFESPDGPRLGQDAGIPIAVDHESLPPGLEDIVFVHRDEPVESAADDELLPPGLEDLTLVARTPSEPNGSDTNGTDTNGTDTNGTDTIGNRHDRPRRQGARGRAGGGR